MIGDRDSLIGLCQCMGICIFPTFIMQSKKIFLLIFVILLIPYLLISLYCHPSGDDYTYASSTLYKGYWFSYIRDYHVWNGRFTSNLLVFASPLVLHSFTLYKLAPILLMFLTYAASLFFIKTITGGKTGRLELHISVSGMLLLYLWNAPSLYETFYWFTGAVTYQAANILTLVYLSLLFAFTKGDYYFNKIIHAIMLLLLIPIICGFNEVIMLIMLVFNIFFAYRWFQQKWENRIIIIFVLVVTLTAAAGMIFSPGNGGRSAFFPDKHQLFHSLYMTVLQMGRFILKWVAQAPVVIATIMFVPVSKYLNEVSPFFKNNFYVSPPVPIICLSGLIFLCVFPAYWSMGMLAQHRTLNVAYFFFIPLWFMNVHAAINYFTSKGRQIKEPDKKYKPVLIGLFIAGLLFTHNEYNVITDILSRKAGFYDNEMNRRYYMIKAAAIAGTEEIIVEDLNAKPVTLYFYDIKCNPDHWINKGYADYFGMKRVRLRTCN